MNTPKITWKESRTSSGKNAVIGRWKVGSYYSSAFVSRDDPKNIVATCLLPGIKNDLGRYSTTEEAETVVMAAIDLWFGDLDK